MNDPIILDSRPLGLATHPKGNERAEALKQWIDQRFAEGRRVIIPAIVDYEVRRELILARLLPALGRLDLLCRTLEFVKLSPEALQHAAELWANVRHQGRSTADRHALDGDCILAAQVIELNKPDAIVVTDNATHIARFVRADTWENII